MTAILSGKDVAAVLQHEYAAAVIETGTEHILVAPESFRDVARYIKYDAELQLEFLVGETAVDYYDYFEVVCHLLSMKKKQTFTLKTRIYDRENPSLPSLYPVWQGADFQEREIYDLMGISFEGHPDLRRIFLWEGFPGHPLRKDFIG
jgi:NADH-quinone oxidoreductase subunit C